MRRVAPPRVLVDIQHPALIRSRVRTRISLRKRVEISHTLILSMKTIGIGIAAASFLVGAVSAPTMQSFAVADAATAQQPVSPEERAALEAQLKELEGQIDTYEGQISGYKKQGDSLNNEVKRLGTKIESINLRIRAIKLNISQIDNQIQDTQSKIIDTQDTITSRKRAIGTLIRDLYQADQSGLMEVFLQKPRLSDFFSEVNDATLVKSSLQSKLVEVVSLHEQLVDQKQELAAAKADAEEAKQYQDAQRSESEKVRQQQKQLLDVTRGQESRYRTLLQQTKQTAAQIRSRIFELLGGGELSFEQAYQFAKVASGATGVRPAIILAVLDRESALGRNVGKCSYTTAMNPKEQPTFLEITKNLGLNPETMMVSCPNADGVYGGAMGPAQFIPSTWKMYEDQIKSVTGKSQVSPWNSGDAFIATGLYMRDAGAAAGTIAKEREAAARYYAGGRWKRFLWTYGQAVINRAEKFQDDIEAITG